MTSERGVRQDDMLLAWQPTLFELGSGDACATTLGPVDTNSFLGLAMSMLGESAALDFFAVALIQFVCSLGHLGVCVRTVGGTTHPSLGSRVQKAGHERPGTLLFVPPVRPLAELDRDQKKKIFELNAAQLQ